MSARLRVVMVTTSYPRFPGDFAGHFVESLASEISAIGHDVTVVAPHSPGAPLAEENAGVAIRRVRYAPDAFERLAYGDGIPANVRRNPALALTAPALAGALRREVGARATGADVVHAHWAPTSALSRAAHAGAPLVVSLHGSDLALARKGGLWRALLERGIAGASALNVMAVEQREDLVARGLFGGPIEVIPSGIPAALCERPRPERSAGAAGFEVLFVGRLVPGKGVHDLVVAFERVAAAVPGARLTVAGSGPAAGDVAAAVTARGLGEQVRFLGEVSHGAALELMAASDVLALPSFAEGSPLSVTEALALGTPVVGTRVGAMPELVGKSGVLVEAGDTGGLADALIGLAADPQTRERMSVLARERMAREYTWPAVAARTVELYRTAIERAGGAR